MVRVVRKPVLVRAMACAIAVSGLFAASGSAFDGVDFEAQGADRKLARALAGASLTLQAEAEGDDDPQGLFAAARTDYGRILGALYAQGYYGGVVSILIDGREAADIPAIDAPQRIDRISITVTPGRQFRFGAARMKPYAPGTLLPPAYRDGQIAYSTAIQDAALAGVDGWRALGHAKARIAGQDITADHATGRIDAQILLEAGPRLRFGALALTGNERMKAHRIVKIAGYREGETFDPAVLDRMQARLRRTGIFRSVTITEADRPGPGDMIGIKLDVEEEALRRFGFGAEVSSADGANLSAFWLHRNVFGGGERLRFDALLKGIDAATDLSEYRLGARIERPGTPSTDSSAFIETSFERSDILGARIEDFSFGLGVERVINERLTLEAGLQYQNVLLEDGSFRDRFRLLALPTALEWDRRGDILNPKSGSYVRLGATPFWGFGTTDSGAQLTADARLYRSFGTDDRVTFAGRVQLGTVAGSALLNTPPNFLFYSGGAGTVRGHPFQSLGVTTTRPGGGAATVGGLSFIGLSGEVRSDIGNRLGAAIFYDAGYISAANWFGAGGDWQAGAGIGVRYDTGFGPVRLDIAFPVSGTTGDGVQIYVGLGQSF